MSENKELDNYLENHYINRSNWLRAAVLGANDGILSTASIAIGVAAASATREPIILAALAGLVAGALSMSAGEYVSVSSQTDVEKAENKELPTTMPFGKYKDIKLSKIPKSYKRWCVENLNFNNNKLLKKALQASI